MHVTCTHTHTYKHAQTTRAIQLIRKEVTYTQTQKVVIQFRALCFFSSVFKHHTQTQCLQSFSCTTIEAEYKNVLFLFKTELKFTYLEIICRKYYAQHSHTYFTRWLICINLLILYYLLSPCDDVGVKFYS